APRLGVVFTIFGGKSGCRHAERQTPSTPAAYADSWSRLGCGCRGLWCGFAPGRQRKDPSEPALDVPVRLDRQLRFLAVGERRYHREIGERQFGASQIRPLGEVGI